MDGHRDQRLIRALVAILAVLTLSGQILEAERAPKVPSLEMNLLEARVVSVARGGAAEKAGIREEDIIAAVGPWRVTPRREPAALMKRFEAGEEIPLELLRGGRRLRAVFVAPPPRHIDILWRFALAGVGVITMLIGILVFFKKPRHLTLIFAGLCYGMGYLFYLPYVPRVEWMVLARDVMLEAVTVFTPPLLVHLFLLFPFRHGVLEKRPRLLWLLYVPSFLLMIFSQVSRELMPDAPPTGVFLEIGYLCAGLIWVGGIGVALWLFVRSYRRACTDISRAKVRVVLWGTALGLLPVAFLLVIRQLWPGMHFPGDRLAVLSTVLIPLSFGYAIVRHGIFDATDIVRRSLGFTIAAVLILVAYFGASLLLRQVLDPLPGGSALLISFLSMLAAGLLFFLIQGQMQSLLRRAIGAEQRDHKSLLYDLGQSLGGLTDREQLVRVITEFTGEALRTERVAFFEKTDGGDLESAYLDGLPVEKLRRYRFSPILSGKLKKIAAPIDRGDLETELPFGYLSPADQEVLEALGVEVIVPLRSRESFRGLIFVGRQTLGEPFTSEDLRVAETIAAEGSIALENAVLQHKLRREAEWRYEVGVARDLQKRLLPSQMPQVESLEISGFSVPAEGVGGDYYDCFRTPWGEIVMAIADASGKGVPGAILMANLQGLVKGEGVRREAPARIVERINRRLCEMNKPERYITFCFSRIDPLTGTLAYCNAGHPSPLLVRSGGRIEELTLGGLPLGIRSRAGYEGGSTVMRAGDVLLLYTDGITERQRNEAIFGERRLQEIVRKHRRMSARALQEMILSAARRFAPTPLDDDTTILVVKML